MRLGSGWGSWAALLVVGFLSCLPGHAQAHPNLIGKWAAPVPPGSSMAYEFEPGEYVGNWVWNGTFTLFLGNCTLSTGTYQLLLFSGAEGTVTLRDGNGLSVAVANVDFGARTLSLKNVVFRP